MFYYVLYSSIVIFCSLFLSFFFLKVRCVLFDVVVIVVCLTDEVAPGFRCSEDTADMIF